MTHPAVILRDAWSIYGKNFKSWLVLVSPLAGLAAVFIIGGGFFPNLADSLSTWTALGFFLLIVAVLVFATRVFGNATIIAANNALSGHPTKTLEAYRQGLKLFWPTLWVEVLRLLLTLAGLILLVVPGIIWGLRYSLATQTVILENKRGLDAFRRSKELTSGKLLEAGFDFGSIGLVLGYGTWICFAATMLVIMILGSIAIIPLTASAKQTVITIFYALGLVGEVGVIWLALPFSPLLFTAIYRDFVNNK